MNGPDSTDLWPFTCGHLFLFFLAILGLVAFWCFFCLFTLNNNHQEVKAALLCCREVRGEGEWEKKRSTSYYVCAFVRNFCTLVSFRFFFFSGAPFSTKVLLLTSKRSTTTQRCMTQHIPKNRRKMFKHTGKQKWERRRGRKERIKLFSPSRGEIVDEEEQEQNHEDIYFFSLIFSVTLTLFVQFWNEINASRNGKNVMWTILL